MYTESIDTGGNAAVLGAIGFGNEYSLSDYTSTLWLPKHEYALVSKAIMAKNAGLKESKLKPVDFVFATDEFYVYENHSIGNFTVIAKLDTVNKGEEIRYIMELINDGTDTNRQRFNVRAGGFRIRKRSDTGNIRVLENSGAKRTNAGLSDRQLGSDTFRESTGISEDKTPDKTKYSLSTYDTDAEELTSERKKTNL